MSDINTPTSVNGWHINPQLVPRLRIGMRGTEAHVIEVPFDASGLLPDGSTALREDMREQLAAKLRDDPHVATFIQLRRNLTQAERGLAEAKIQREQADLDRRRLLMVPLTPPIMEQINDNAARWREADGGMASCSAAKQAIEQELEPARRKAEHRLDRELQLLAGAAMERISGEIPRLAAALGDAAGPHLDALAVALQQLRYSASMTQNMRGDFLDILDELQPTATPAALDAPPADTPPEPPAEIRRRVPVAAATAHLPSVFIQTHEHVPVQTEFVEVQVEPAVAEAGPAEPTSEPTSESAEPASASAEPTRPRRRGK
jgi:hypothetical protein